MFIRDLFPVESASLPIGVFVSGIHGGSKIAKYLSIEGTGSGLQRCEMLLHHCARAGDKVGRLSRADFATVCSSGTIGTTRLRSISCMYWPIID